MLNAQGVQGPALPLDTGWLLIKHVDEMISFIPTGASDRPFKVLVVDPKAMIQLLEKWEEEGYGDSPALRKFSTNTTVSSLLKNEKLISHNINLQESRIEPNIDLLKREFGLDESDFVRIPAMFNSYGGAVFPNLVNSLVLNGFIFASEPDGPVIGGKDLLKEEFNRLLSDLPLKRVFLDDRQYHIWSGNVHCATNVKREGFKLPWWDMLK
jgi:protein-arginine deiminase